MKAASLGLPCFGGGPLALLIALFGGGPFLETMCRGQDRESLAGPSAAQQLKSAAENEAQQYNLRYGPWLFRTEARVRVGYTDNVFYSDENRRDDVIINPEVNFGAFLRVSELNALRLSLGLGYEYYTRNSVLNGNAPLVNPDSELAFNLFVSNFHIRLREKFSYQETLFYSSLAGRQDLYFNFNNVGRFARWNNLVGTSVDWDLDKLIVSAGYDHENFTSTTAQFDYMTRSSELLSGSVSFLIGDQARTGVESHGSLNDFDRDTTLNDHWRVQAGPFVEVKPQEKINFRVGGGYDTAHYGSGAADSNLETWYAYGRVSHETRFFTHSLSAGREHLIGDNANNLKTTYVRYAISTPLIEHFDLGANAAVHFAEEFGGAFREKFTYYIVGLRAGYQFHKYWRTDLAYEFMLKNSDLALRDFYRDRVTLGLTFSF